VPEHKRRENSRKKFSSQTKYRDNGNSKSVLSTRILLVPQDSVTLVYCLCCVGCLLMEFVVDDLCYGLVD